MAKHLATFVLPSILYAYRIICDWRDMFITSRCCCSAKVHKQMGLTGIWGPHEHHTNRLWSRMQEAAFNEFCCHFIRHVISQHVRSQ